LSARSSDLGASGFELRVGRYPRLLIRRLTPLEASLSRPQIAFVIAQAGRSVETRAIRQAWG
jgi:hypothetical protein